MGSWLGWLFILGGVYIAVIVARAMIEFASWCIEEFLPEEPLEPDEPVDRHHSERHTEAAADHRVSPSPHLRLSPPGEKSARWGEWGTFAARISLLHWLAPLAEFARMLIHKGQYDYWIGRALAEDDAAKKVKYLSKALALNPGYAPGWGLKANALLALKKYQEALDCLEKTLQLSPSPIAWYEKGLCCHHLGRYDEAIQSFDKALAGCSAKNVKIREDALRGKRLAESLRKSFMA